MARSEAEGREDESLPEALSHILEECRMVLPGIQALFGFQLIAVFSQHFDRLSAREQALHLLATGLVAVAVALVMSPAAYHRQVEPESVSRSFLRLAGTLLLLSMWPLAMGISIDFFLITRLVLGESALAIGIAALLFVVFVSLWSVFPHVRRRRGR